MNFIHERAVMRLLHFFMMRQAAAGLNARIVLNARSSPRHQKEEILTPYCKVINNFLKTLATHDTIEEIDA